MISSPKLSPALNVCATDSTFYAPPIHPPPFPPQYTTQYRVLVILIWNLTLNTDPLPILVPLIRPTVPWYMSCTLPTKIVTSRDSPLPYSIAVARPVAESRYSPRLTTVPAPPVLVCSSCNTLTLKHNVLVFGHLSIRSPTSLRSVYMKLAAYTHPCRVLNVPQRSSPTTITEPIDVEPPAIITIWGLMKHVAQDRLRHTATLATLPIDIILSTSAFLSNPLDLLSLSQVCPTTHIFSLRH